MYEYGNPHMVLLSVNIPMIPVTVTNVTWIPDTIYGQVVWRLDTMRVGMTPQPQPATYQNYVIHDVSELGHVASKSKAH